MSKLVAFLEEMNRYAAQYVAELEKIIIIDPSSAIVKGRKFLEAILEDIPNYENDIDEKYKYLSLYEKIEYLKRVHIIDGRQIEKSFDTVRMIGNRGAHHSQTNEFEDAFTIHREIYNISIWYYELYFYSKNIKAPFYESPISFVNHFTPPTDPKHENSNIELSSNDKNLIENNVNEIVSSNSENTYKIDDKVDDPMKDKAIRDHILDQKLSENESYLVRELVRLKSSSKEAIENPEQFSYFKKYLHVNRPIQNDLEKILNENNQKEQGHLILLCGNVGDGKSHVLAYLNNEKPELVKNYKIYNDATESFSPQKDALTTLEETLSGFSDEKIDSNTENIILAINMGILHNFINMNHKKHSYKRLVQFIEESGIFSSDKQPLYQKDHFSLLSFGDYNSFELTEKGPISSFYSTLLNKIIEPTEHNPFYIALQLDEERNVQTIVHDNFKLLQNKNVQNRIIQLVIQCIIMDKLVISARTFLNFISDILIPNNYESLYTNGDKNNRAISALDNLELTLPNLLFNHKDRSEMLNTLAKLDPLHRRSDKIDQLVINLNTLTDWEKIIQIELQDKVAVRWFTPFFNSETLSGYSFELFFETFIRTIYLLNNEFADSLIDESYPKFVSTLYNFNRGNSKEIKKTYEDFKEILFMWKGSPKKDYIYMNKPSENFRIAQRIHLKPSIAHLSFEDKDVIDKFKPTIPIIYQDPRDHSKLVKLEIDYSLYYLLYKVKNGYRPNKSDEEKAVKFLDFIDKIMDFGDKKEELLIYFKQDDQFFVLKKDDFGGSYVFERE